MLCEKLNIKRQEIKAYLRGQLNPSRLEEINRLCRALGDNVEHPCSTKALAKRDMLIAGLGHLPRLKFAALSKVSA